MTPFRDFPEMQSQRIDVLNFKCRLIFCGGLTCEPIAEKKGLFGLRWIGAQEKRDQECGKAEDFKFPHFR
jgi:hypothetical protein